METLPTRVQSLLKSIPYIVTQNETLGGLVNYCVATTMSDYGSVSMGGQEFFAAEINFEVRL